MESLAYSLLLLGEKIINVTPLSNSVTSQTHPQVKKNYNSCPPKPGIGVLIIKYRKIVDWELRRHLFITIKILLISDDHVAILAVPT